MPSIRSARSVTIGGMPRWPRFSLRYLLAVVFWWALALGLTREYLVSDKSYEHRVACYLSSAVAWGGAYGGVALRMRFGLIAGFFVAVAIGSFLFWTASHYY
jgi:hypothetical protein